MKEQGRWIMEIEMDLISSPDLLAFDLASQQLPWTIIFLHIRYS